MTWEERFVTIVREGGHTLFFERFLQAVEITSLVIVSPWIRTLVGEPISLKDIMLTVKKRKVPTTVIMRSPEKEPMNREAAEVFQASSLITLYYNNDLHAKIYVCRCQPFGFALLGSANLSGRATRALEIGIMIEGKGHGCSIIEQLESLGKEDIPNRSGTILKKIAKTRYGT
jgi:hypothetical protein